MAGKSAERILFSLFKVFFSKKKFAERIWGSFGGEKRNFEEKKWVRTFTNLIFDDFKINFSVRVHSERGGHNLNGGVMIIFPSNYCLFLDRNKK